MVIKVGAGATASTACSCRSLSAVVRILLFDRGLLSVTPDHGRRCRRCSSFCFVPGGRAEGLCDRCDHARDAALQRVAHDLARPGSSEVTVPGRGTSTSRCRSPSCRWAGVPSSANDRRRAPGGVLRRADDDGDSNAATHRLRRHGAVDPPHPDERLHRHGLHGASAVGHGWIAITPFLLVVCAAAAAAGPRDAARGRHHLGLAVCNHGGRMGMGHRRRPAHHAPHGCRRDLGGGCDLRDRLHRRAHGLASIDGPARVALSWRASLSAADPGGGQECAPLPRAGRVAGRATCSSRRARQHGRVMEEYDDDEQRRDGEEDRRRIGRDAEPAREVVSPPRQAERTRSTRAGR